MAQWIYCWELGGGIGHLSRMQAVSQGLATSGHQITWCVPRPFAALAETYWSRVISAPDEIRPPPSVTAPGSLAEIVQNEGWNDARRVAGWIGQWEERFKAVGAERILLDFAPNALLAGVASGRRLEVVGTGFYIPPDKYPLPAVRDDHGIYPDRLKWAEDSVASVLSEWVPESGPGLRGLFHHGSVRNHLVTHQDLDHYGARPGVSYLGVVTGFSGEAACWPTSSARRIFAYFKPFPHLAHLLQMIHRAGVHLKVHGNSEVAAVVRGMALDGVEFHDSPVDERSVQNAGAMMIHHAGHDGTAKALMAGIALLQLPLNIEQSMTARNAERLGVASWLSVEQVDRFEQALVSLLGEQASRSAAALTWAESQPKADRALDQLLDDLDRC